jgi:beta-N-acetylhexosaminidase
MTSLRRTSTALTVGIMAVGILAASTACSRATTPGAGPSQTATSTVVGSVTASGGPTPAATPTRTASATPTVSASATPTGRPDPRPTASPTATPTPTVASVCSTQVGKLTNAEVAGQLLMISVSSSGLTSSTAATIDNRRIGSVFLLDNSRAGVTAIRRLANRIHALGGGKTHIMLAADQEGGLVQRLQGPGFTRMPSALTQSTESTSRLETDATTWGRQLRSAGIDLDLAPVADVVPKSLQNINQPIGVLHRGYGPHPSVVASHVVAFAGGMQKAGRATSVKHFPGLGRVRGNTDFDSGVKDPTTTRTDAYLAPFKAAIDAGVPAVMISLAIYTRIDKRQQAVFSHPVVTDLLRHQLGFTGVIVSDDLGAARQVGNVAPGDRALRFIRAGGDLITVAGNSAAATMSAAIVAQMNSDRAFAAIARTAAQHVLAMKHRYGLYPC